MKGKEKTSEKINLFFPDEKEVPGDTFIMVEKSTGEVFPVAEVVTSDEETKRMESVQKTLGRFRFVVVFQDRYDEITKSITPVASRVLSYMISKMKLGNRVYNSSYADISKELGISPMTVGRGINVLIDSGIVAKIMEKNRPIYFIDPTLCYKGKINSHKRLHEDYERLRPK